MRFEFKATEAGDKSISGMKRKNQSGFRGWDGGGGGVVGIADRPKARSAIIYPDKAVRKRLRWRSGPIDRSIDRLFRCTERRNYRQHSRRVWPRGGSFESVPFRDWKLVRAESDRSIHSFRTCRISLRNRRALPWKAKGKRTLRIATFRRAPRRFPEGEWPIGRHVAFTRNEQTRVPWHVRDRSNRSARSIIARA